MLNRMNNSKKISGVSGSLAAGLVAARTASRGAGVASSIGESNVSFYGMSDQSFPSPRANETSQERNKYKKLVVNQEIQRPPAPKQDEKAQIKMQNFAANNYLIGNSSKVPLKAFSKCKLTKIFNLKIIFEYYSWLTSITTNS